MTIRSVVLLVLLICVGFLGNYYTIPLFFGADFLFGSIAVLLVLYFYGLRWGIIAAVLVHGYTYVLWGHPYGFLNFVSEALFVGLFLKRGKRKLLAADGIFWLLVGMPMVWLEHGVAMHMDATTTIFIMLKQAVNGVFNAMLASLAICFLPLEKLFQRPKFSLNISFQESLFNLLVMMILLPALLITLVEIRHEKEDLENDIVTEIQSMSANLRLNLHSWLQQRLQALQELARLASTSSMTSAPLLQLGTEILKQTFLDFSTLHVENVDGRTIAFSPPVNELGKSTINHDFSDRAWFNEAKANQKPVVSELFHGRIGVFAPIIAIVAPIMRENQFVGTAAASVNLKMVEEMLKPYNLGKARFITLTDSKGQVIASTAPERSPMGIWDWKKTGVSQPLKARMYHWYPDDQTLPSMTRWKQSFYVQEISLGPELPWLLTIEVPVDPLQQALYTIYVKNLTIIALLMGLALPFSLFLSRWLTGPITQLAQVSADLPVKLPEAKNIDWPVSAAIEINTLIANTKSMACTLEKNFYELQMQSEELSQANRNLLQEMQERQKAEDEKTKLEAQLVQTQKMEAIGTLAGGIAHDFNNILTAIIGNISLAMLDLQMQESSRARLTEAEKACLQAQNLSRQLLTFSKGGAPIKEVVSVNRLIIESVSFACRGSQVNYKTSLPNNLWAVEADPGQISQVLQNLVINAIQAMPTGGMIKIQGENVWVTAESELPLDIGRYVKISIQDEGTGILAEHLSRIFEPYFTTKQKGSGLGLAISYSIIKRHHGHIAAESELGTGTTFNVYLPACNREVVQPRREDGKLLCGKGKILIMDDEAMVREVLGKMLLSLGYEVAFAENGTEAIEVLSHSEESGDPFAAAILDLTIPGGMGGKEAMASLLKINPQVKAIASSGYSDDPVMADFKKYGFSAVLAKPYKVSELGKILNQALDGKT